MARQEDWDKLSTEDRRHRYFSADFKRKIVRDLDRKILTVTEVSKAYQVSRAAIYKWIDKYSMTKKKTNRMIVEAESDTRKVLELKKKIRELEQLVGQKQVKIDFMEKMIELTEDDLNIKIKKKEE